MADRPKTRFTDTESIPAYLRQQGRFCLWKYEEHKDRWTKVPYQPKATQYGAASTNPQHFTDLQTALKARAGFDGIGVGIFGDLAAIDIDHCISEAGELSLLAQTVIETIDSYTEYSPSGKGIRIFFRAPGVNYDKSAYYINQQDARDQRQSWPEKQGLEVYIAGVTAKYVTITGNALRSVDVAERSAQIQQILDRYMKKAPAARPAIAPAPSITSLSDHELIETAIRARNGAQFKRLYVDGDIGRYPSHSEADQALFNLLAFYTGGDAARMIQLFKASALYRADKSGGDRYLERTAQKAIRDCKDYYTPPQEKREAASYNPVAPAEEPQEQEAYTTATAVDAFLERARTEDYKPIPTGYKSIDTAIGGGFIAQTLCFLGASPGSGKTLFAQQIFERIAKEGRAQVIYYNLEMSIEQMLARSLSRATEFTPLQILQGYKWTPQQTPVILQAAEDYKRDIAPRIKYNPVNSADYEIILDSMKREAEALAEEGNTLPLVVVLDYLQLLQGDEGDAVEIIKRAVMELKAFAIRYNAVVFAIMAHSRETNKKGIVTQGAGRDTSAIEYSGDLQLSLNITDRSGNLLDESGLEKMYSKISDLLEQGKQNDAALEACGRRLTVTKNRFGMERAFAALRFFGEHSLFVEAAHKYEEKQARRYEEDEDDIETI